MTRLQTAAKLVNSSLTFLLLAIVSTTACRSHGIDVTIQNNAAVPLRNVELDYPGGAFGTGLIAPGASYWYHIKPNADGELTLTFQRDNGTMVQQKGPEVRGAERGRMILLLDQDADKQWHLRAQRK